MKVVIFSQGEMAKVLYKIFQDNGKYQVAGTTYAFLELTRMLDLHKKLIIVLDISRNEGVFPGVFALAKTKSMKVLVICSSVKQGFDILGKGAHEMVSIPKDIESKSFGQNLLSKVSKLDKEYDESNQRRLKHNFNKNIGKIICIGSSTGGTEVIMKILKAMPPDSPPVLIVQHMPVVFTNMYAKRLDQECKISVWEAKDGDELKMGLALIAEGDKHMRLIKRNNKFMVSCAKGAAVSGHVPSVDVLFESAANMAGKISVGVILTGMGGDGAKGLLKMREAGAITISQDQKSCVVYGMPKVAHDIGASAMQGNPDEIIKMLLNIQ